VIGEAWPSGQGHAARVAAFLEQSGVPIRRSEDLVAAKWGKMAWNCAFNPLTALCERTVGAVMSDDALRAVAWAAAEEVAALARASGVKLGADVADQLFLENADLGHLHTSMLQDLRAGRRSENEELSGEIVRRSRSVGCPAPTNTTLYALVRAREAGYGTPPSGS